MDSIARATLVWTIVGVIFTGLGVWLAMPNLLEYLANRRQERYQKDRATIRLLMIRTGRTGYADLWLESKLPQKRLDAILDDMETSEEVRVYDDGSRKMVELRYGSQARKQ